MAITYVGGRTASPVTVAPSTVSLSLTTLTGGTNSAPSAGDVVFISYSEGAGADTTLSGKLSASGYTFVTEIYANDSADANMAVFYKVMGATPDTDVVIVGKSGAAAAITLGIAVFRGVDLSSPLDVTTTTAVGVNGANANPPAITPVTAGNVILVFGGSAEGLTTNSYTSGSTSYLTQFRQTLSLGGTYGVFSGFGHVTGQSPSVSYDPAQWLATIDSVICSWAAATLALRPAAQSIALTPNSITTAAPSVGASSLAQVHSLTANGITAGQPSIGASVLVQSHSLTAIGIATGTPIVSASSLAQVHSLTANGITTGIPIVGSASTSGAIDLTADSVICGQPTIGAATLAQNHVIVPNGIATRQPTVGNAIVTQAHDLTAANTTTAPPTVGSASAQVIININANGITTEQPSIQASTVAQVHSMGAQNITTGAPQIQPSACVVQIALAGVSITTGQPVVGQIFINASRRRDVHVSQASNSVAVVAEGGNASVLANSLPSNAAVVTGGSNYSIVSANTPNSVIVTRSNEAA